MTHTKVDCLERPRKLGAKFTGRDIAPDEHIPVRATAAWFFLAARERGCWRLIVLPHLQEELPLSFEGKRDRWQDYDPAEHVKVIREYEKVRTRSAGILAEAGTGTGCQYSAAMCLLRLNKRNAV
jgi:pre-mRNA-processing factor SLU7